MIEATPVDQQELAGHEPARQLPALDSAEKLELIVEAANDMKAHDITVLDVRGQTIVTDYFVICTGSSVTHIRSIAEGVQDRLREKARERTKPEGDALSFWVILDYSDVLLHVFDEETRDYYDLERLWSDAKVTYRGDIRTERTENADKPPAADQQDDAA